tara:strand:- start:2164 stop:2751 length:588 start_codon:yes stop_codon:yes gene_type:complete
MSLASKAGDLLYTFRFLKMLTTPWEESDAFKLGLIDENGKRVKSERIDSKEKKLALGPFVRLVFNLKRALNKVPGGKTTLGSYAAALFLLKEHYQISDKNIKKILDTAGVDPLDLISEDHSWYILDNGCLSPGIYRVKEEKVLATGLEDVVNAKDQIRVNESSRPIGEVLGLHVFEAYHLNTHKRVYVTVGEIYK